MPLLTTLSVVMPGSDLLPTLHQLSAGGDVWIDGTGYLDQVELRVAAEGEDVVRVLPGRFTLVHLAGPAAGAFFVMLARMTESGFEVVGGEVIRARSAGVTLAIHPCAPSASRSVVSAEPIATTAAAPTALASSSLKPVWARAAAASAAAARAAEPEEEYFPEAGDLVEHFAFGLSEVLTSDGDRLRIRDLKDPGRVREVSLSMLRVMEPTDSDGKRVFRLSRRVP